MTIKRPDNSADYSARELHLIGDQLRADGHDALAVEYSRRAAEARTAAARAEDARDHLRDLSVTAFQIVGKALDREKQDAQLVGPDGAIEDLRPEAAAALMDWLTDHGWTPPKVIDVVVPTAGEGA